MTSTFGQGLGFGGGLGTLGGATGFGTGAGAFGTLGAKQSTATTGFTGFGPQGSMH